MTTGRINQVANPSSARGESTRPAVRVPGPRTPVASGTGGTPRGTPEERCCTAKAGHRVPRPTGSGGATRRWLGRRRSARAPVTSSLAGSVAVAVVLGREVPSHTPLAHVLASLLGPVRDLSVSALDSAADQLPGAGRTTHWASSSLLIGVRSVDNYGGPAQ